jgi:prepilin-type N-terminal cleavage/methylation domain-containing protein
MSHLIENKVCREEREGSTGGVWGLGFGVWGLPNPVSRRPAPSAFSLQPSAFASGGFTLLEVLVALAILATGIMGAMQLFPAAMRQTHVSAERTNAANLANSELTRLRSLDMHREFLSWVDKNTLESLSSVERAYSMYDGWFTTVQQAGGSSDTYRVTFSVQMMDGRRETFVTYVTRR